MRILLLVVFIICNLTSTSQILSQDIEWRTDLFKINKGIYEIRFTLIPSKNWWTSSPFQDTMQTDLLCTKIVLNDTDNILTLGKLEEVPISNETTEIDGEVVRWVKSKTTYVQRIKLKNHHPFIATYSIFYQPRTHEFVLPTESINGQIVYSENELSIKKE